SWEQCVARILSVAALAANSLIRRQASSRNFGGHKGSAGSGQRAAQITARQAANGLRAHQIWSVEMWPCRMDFSLRACAEICLMGRSTSMRRFGYECIRWFSLLTMPRPKLLLD